ALSVQTRRAPGRVVAFDAARALAARPRPLSVSLDRAAAASARRGGLAGDAGRHGVVRANNSLHSGNRAKRGYPESSIPEPWLLDFEAVPFTRSSRRSYRGCGAPIRP